MVFLNIKVNGSKIFKFIFIGIIIILVIILGIVCYKVFSGSDKSTKRNKYYPDEYVSNISSKNYTNILKTVHENIDDYIGSKISFTGYIYRVSDLKENQFVLARDMLINSESQSVVVGFLSEYEKAKDLENNTWISITGEIIKGNYHGDMPILKITDLKIVDKPKTEEYVYPPDDSYIPTSSLL